MFAGDSEVYRSFSPLQLFLEKGITSYNLSESALRLCDCAELIFSTYEYQKSSVIVLEADAIFADSNPHKDAYALPTNLIEDIFPIFHYHIFYKAAVPGFIVDASVPLRTENLLRGYVETDMAVPYEGDPNYMMNEVRTRMSGDSEYYLNEILSFCRSHDLSLLLTAVPCPANWNKGKHDLMTEWAKERGVPFLDMNMKLDEIGIDWQKDTMDGGNHVSFEGSKKVPSYIGNYLEEHYDLPDHRNDEAFRNWYEANKEAELY